MVDFLNAFAEGQRNAQQIRNNRAINQARQAQIQQHGVEAGDPVNALRVQRYEQNKLTNPLDVVSKQLANQGQRETNKFKPVQTDYYRTLNQGQKIKNAGAQSTLDATQKQQHAARVYSGMSTLANGLQAALSRGEDPAKAFDTAAPIIARLTNMPIAQLRQQRANFIADPQGELNTLHDQLNALQQSSLTPQDRADIAATNAQTYQRQQSGDLSRARITGEQQDQALKAKKGAVDVGALRSTYANLHQIQQRIEQLGPRTAEDGSVEPGQIDQALNAAQNLSSSPFINKKEAELGFGNGNRFVQAAEALKHQLSLADLQAMKKSGAFSGRVLKTEFDAFAAAYANLDPGAPKEQLVRSIKAIKRLYPSLINAVNVEAQNTADKIKKAGGEVPTTPGTSLPSGIPEGSQQIGTYKGQPAYKTPDGRTVVAQ